MKMWEDRAEERESKRGKILISSRILGTGFPMPFSVFLYI